MTMENKLGYGYRLPLKKISLRRVAILLWCRSDILFELDMPDVESKVEDIMEKLEIPPLLIEPMKYLVKPICSELRNWKKFHEEYLQIGNINMISISKHLCWTMLGTIDYPKTAENLIRHKTFDTVMLYRLACLYCFDEHIRVLWGKLPEERKKYFYKEEGPLELTEPRLEFSWPYILKGEETRLDYVLLNPFGERPTFYQCAFEYSANKGNKAATLYFARKLTCAVRSGSLFRLVAQILTRDSERRFDEYSYDEFPAGKIPDILFYLFSLMADEQLLEFCLPHISKLLVYFLYWPWQDLLLDSAEFMRSFLKFRRQFFNLMKATIIKIELGFDLTKMFQEVFVRSSSDCINRFMEDESFYVRVLCWFIEVKDSESIKIIFRKLDSVQRETLVSSEPVFKLFCESISRGQWPLVELCLQEATLSKERKKELKQTYAGFFPYINLNVDISLIERIWKKFRDFFDENQVNISSKRKSDKEG